MKANVGGMDKNIRIAVGILLILLAIFSHHKWAWIGIIPLATGLFNFCPLYTMLGKSTCNRS